MDRGGREAPALAAMRLLLDAPTLDAARSAADPSVLPLLSANAFARVKGVAGAVDHAAVDAGPDAALARIAASFDRAAAVSPDAGVALYALGDPALLAEATQEVCAWLRARGLVRPGGRVLEVGAGAGRFLAALAGELELAVGLEVSPVMAVEAARRTTCLPNVAVVLTGGRDLACIAERSVDLVLFADSFPYLVQAGGDLPARHMAESARVLRRGGRVAILNLSYRGDPGRDEADLRAWCQAAGLAVVSAGERPFRRWDATAHVVRRVNDD